MPKNQEHRDLGDGLLAIEDAAKYLTISPRTLRSMMQHGKIPVVDVSERRIAIAKDDLDRYIEQQRRTGPRRRFGRWS